MTAQPDAALPARLRALVRRLRTPARRAAACEAVLRSLPQVRTPDRVAARLVDLGFEWMGGRGWAVVGQDAGRGLSWLYDRGVAGTRRSALTALASRAVEIGEPVFSEDASGMGPTRIRGPFAALALPLRCEGRVVGVLTGVDGRGARAAAREGGSSAALPGGEDLDAVWMLVDPLAAALDASLRLSRAEKLSSIDDLTGLYNSRFLAGALQRETKRALRTHRPLSVLFIDLDGFKGINDRWGHLFGSKALVEAADRIASGARETDVVARFGGDEFAIVLPEALVEGATIVAQRVRERIAGRPFLEADGIGYRLTASVGVATLSEGVRTPEHLLSAADAAMYRVKARGKDGIEIAGKEA